MPHSILRAPAHHQITDFSKKVYQHGDRTIILLDVYQNLRNEGYVFLVHLEETQLTQEVLIQVTPRGDGTTLVRTAKFGSPLITEGVKLAVRSVTEYLQDLGYQVEQTAF